MKFFDLFFVGKFHIEYALRPKQEVENQINSKLTSKSKTKTENSFVKKFKIFQISQDFLQCRKGNYGIKSPFSPKQVLRNAISSTITSVYLKLIATVKKGEKIKFWSLAKNKTEVRPRPGATQTLKLQLGNFTAFTATTRTGAAFVVISRHTCTWGICKFVHTWKWTAEIWTVNASCERIGKRVVWKCISKHLPLSSVTQRRS